MDQEQWNIEWYDRTLRYAQRYLDPARTIAVTAAPSYLASVDGQVAVLTAASLLSRMTPSVVLSFPDTAILPELPWAGRSLRETALASMRAANPFAGYAVRDLKDGDFRFHIGPAEAEFIVHGSGWNAYVGPAPSPIPDAAHTNGMGAALAVVIAAAHLFRVPFAPFAVPFLCNAFDWREEATIAAPVAITGALLGHVFAVGLGSVGSAALYFLTMATRNFRATLVDMDRVKVKNITRSPIFSAEDARLDLPKVSSVAAFLKGAGVHDVEHDPVKLNESALWRDRNSGTPDVVISAANEFNVRYHIEMGYPPIQVYATTGKNWQTTLLRHLPGDAACSLCVFPPDPSSLPMACATDGDGAAEAPDQVDAALPFLSFAAGLMTAAEILKLGVENYDATRHKITLNLRAEAAIAKSPLQHRRGCTCETRSRSVHRTMVDGSRYEGFSRFDGSR